MAMLLPVHIVAGGLAVVFGGIALAVSKGGSIHRTIGLFFVYAMVTMGTSASILSLRHGLNANLIAGLTSAYFSITALTAVRPVSDWSRRATRGAAALAFTLAAVEIVTSWILVTGPGSMAHRAPGFMGFFVAAVTLAAGWGDVRVIRFRPLRGAPRLKRHLWRMCFALFIASGSFFSIRARVARVLPELFLSGPMRALPVLLVFVAMFYWMWRLRGRANPVSILQRAHPAS